MKRFGKLITLVLVVAMALSLMSVAALAADSSDYKDVVAGKWYVQYVDWALDKGLMTGISDTEWAPNTATTRGMVITTLYALAGKPEVEGDSPFADVEEGKYYTDAVKWAVKAGVASGKSSDSFKPNDVLTRQEAATFFCAYAKNVMGLDVSDVSGLNKFPDNGDVSNYAKDAMGWAVKANVISGSKEDGVVKLMPKRNITRAELATMLKALSGVVVPSPAPDKIGYGTVVVTVKASDKAVSGIALALTGKDNDDNEISLKATTDAKGVATFENVPASDKTGYSIIATNADARYGEQKAVTAVAVTPKETTEVTYNLDEIGGNVTVTLSATEEARDERAVVGGVKLHIYGYTKDNQYFIKSAVTDEKGVAVFKGVPAGEYTLDGIVENPGTYNFGGKNDVAERYDAPKVKLVANEQSFEVENGDVALSLVLDIPENFTSFKAFVVNGDAEYAREDGSDVNGYQFQVTGKAKNGSNVNIASNYTGTARNKDGEVEIINVPEVAKNAKYTCKLLNAPAWATVTYSPKDASTDGTKSVTATLKIKRTSLEVGLVDSKGAAVKEAGVKLTLIGKTAAGDDVIVDEVTTDINGLAQFENVPYSDDTGYTVFIAEGKYAAVNKNPIVVNDKTEKMKTVEVTTKFADEVKLHLDMYMGADKAANKMSDASGYKFVLTSADGTYISQDATDTNGDLSFKRIPYGTYKVTLLGDASFATTTIKVSNYKDIEGATDNNTVVVRAETDPGDTANVIINVKMVVKTGTVRVFFRYTRDDYTNDLKGISATLKGIPAYELARNEDATAVESAAVKSDTNADNKQTYAEFKNVPFGKYQITIKGSDDAQVEFVDDMYEYEVIDKQNTIVEVAKTGVTEAVVLMKSYLKDSATEATDVKVEN